MNQNKYATPFIQITEASVSSTSVAANKSNNVN